jgi:hypothetical protein
MDGLPWSSLKAGTDIQSVFLRHCTPCIFVGGHRLFGGKYVPKNRSATPHIASGLRTVVKVGPRYKIGPTTDMACTAFINGRQDNKKSYYTPYTVDVLQISDEVSEG